MEERWSQRAITGALHPVARTWGGDWDSGVTTAVGCAGEAVLGVEEGRRGEVKGGEAREVFGVRSSSERPFACSTEGKCVRNQVPGNNQEPWKVLVF